MGAAGGLRGIANQMARRTATWIPSNDYDVLF